VNIHKNARTTVHSRAEIARRVIVEGQAPGVVAAAFGVCLKTVAKWVGRFRAGGLEALADRSSRPHRLHKPTPQLTQQDVIRLRRLRRPGCEIARETGVSASTVSRILRAERLSRARDLDPPQPARRYEHPDPGDMIHLDIKKLGASTVSAIASPATEQPSLTHAVGARAAAGSSSTSASTTPPVSPSPRSIPMKEHPAPSLISRHLSPST